MQKLHFCTIDFYNAKIAEVVFNRNADITVDMVEEFFQVLTRNMGPEISIIVNKTTTFTYKYDALVKLSLSSVIKNLAIVAYDDTTMGMSEFNKQRFNKSGKNIAIFKTREEALSWIESVAS